MRILAIETSCDETGIAVLDGEKTEGGFSFRVLGNALLSQAQLHSEFGGVYPNLAKREHLKNLPVLLPQALKEAGLNEEQPEIDAIAVTRGPGLEPALWTGVTFAEECAKKWNLPLFGINHMEGHFLSALVREDSLTNIQFPVLGLLVSGGHTEFIDMPEWFSYKKIGRTLDDAAGEAFDKVARMLGLPYPGGPQISKLAAEVRTGTVAASERIAAVKLPRPMLQSNSCDVSFSGLKTAALYALRDLGGAETLSQEEKAHFAREFEDTVIDVFVSKARRALETTHARSFALGGGVAANAHLRNALTKLAKEEFLDTEIYIPHPSTTGDNAVMIAEAALVHLLSGDWQLEDGKNKEPLRADGNLSL